MTSYIESAIEIESNKTIESIFTSQTEDLKKLLRKTYEVDSNRVPKLHTLCLYAISQAFDKFNNFIKVSTIPKQDFEFLLELLPTNLHLKYTINVIEDEIYWKRCCIEKWPGRVFNSNRSSNFWKELYLRKFLQENIQEIIHNNETVVESVIELANLINPFINEIELVYFHNEKIEQKTDHLPLNEIMSELKNLRDFCLHGFPLKVLDWESLLSGLNSLSNLSKISIINCELDSIQFINLEQFVLQQNSIEVIDVSNCDLTDKSILIFESILRQHQNLNILRLSDDQINDKGIQSLCYCLSEQFSAPLNVLDISMNMLSYVGACHLASALVRCKEKPKELNVSCCGFVGSSAIVFSECLEYNSSLQSINISSNDFSLAEASLLSALNENKNLIQIEMRFSGISDDASAEIIAILERNKTYEKSDDNVKSETFNLDEPEYLVWEYNPYNPDYIPGYY